jgi:hypothetical protein
MYLIATKHAESFAAQKHAESDRGILAKKLAFLHDYA